MAFHHLASAEFQSPLDFHMDTYRKSGGHRALVYPIEFQGPQDQQR
jgi:hypothetical protein